MAVRSKLMITMTLISSKANYITDDANFLPPFYLFVVVFVGFKLIENEKNRYSNLKKERRNEESPPSFHD